MKVLAWLTIFQTLLCLISLFTEQYGGFCHPALQMRKPRRRDVKSLTPSDAARKGQDLNLCHHHKSKLVSACRALYRAKKMVNPKLSWDRVQVEAASSPWLQYYFLGYERKWVDTFVARRVGCRLTVFQGATVVTDMNRLMWWLILCVNLTRPQGAQIFGQTLFWLFLWRCLWMRLTFESVDWISTSPSLTWVDLSQSAEPWMEKRLTISWVRENFSFLTAFKLDCEPFPLLDTMETSQASSPPVFGRFSCFSGLPTATRTTLVVLGLQCDNLPCRSWESSLAIMTWANSS